jgi:hypothetical protein
MDVAAPCVVMAHPDDSVTYQPEGALEHDEREDGAVGREAIVKAGGIYQDRMQ